MIHDFLAKLYCHQCNPVNVPSFPTNEEDKAHCDFPKDMPFFREGMEGANEEDKQENVDDEE